MPQLSDPNTWLDRHGDYLYRYALFRLKDPSAAEDMVQETLLAAIKSSKNFAGNASERTWLVSILKHKIVDAIRKSQREQPTDMDINTLVDKSEEVFDHKGHWVVNISPWSDPDKCLENDQFWQALEHCIAGLPSRLGEPFILKEVDGMSSTDICNVLNISTTNNLWVILSRARMRLRDCLDKRWFQKSTGERI